MMSDDTPTLLRAQCVWVGVVEGKEGKKKKKKTLHFRPLGQFPKSMLGILVFIQVNRIKQYFVNAVLNSPHQ
jgi:hypothetical protein